MAWVTTVGCSDDVRDLLQAWLKRRLPYEVILNEHSRITADKAVTWCERHSVGAVFLGILDGDDGELTAMFERREDAVHFKLTWC